MWFCLVFFDSDLWLIVWWLVGVCFCFWFAVVYCLISCGFGSGLGLVLVKCLTYVVVCLWLFCIVVFVGVPLLVWVALLFGFKVYFVKFCVGGVGFALIVGFVVLIDLLAFIVALLFAFNCLICCLVTWRRLLLFISDLWLFMVCLRAYFVCAFVYLCLGICRGV